MTEIRKVQQLEKHRKSDPHDTVPLIQIYEWIVAIRYYQEALLFLTPQTASLDYATIQTNLGNVYQSMPSDDRTKNLKQAIPYYQEALRFFTPQTDPSKYAMVQNNLGETYRKLPTDNRANSLTQAIKYYREALHFFTPQTNPPMYAIVQNNLGNVYLELPSGDRAANLEHAIRSYQEALRFQTPQADPLNYAMIQSNLGTAYLDLPIGDRATNLELAIHHSQEALHFRTPQADPSAYARTQTNLGNAYGNRLKGDRMNNLTQAIQYYNNALHFYTPQSDPLNYAMIQSNLGTAYWSLSTGDRAHNLKQAIHYCQEALRFYLPHVDPLKYAGLQNNLGNVYNDLPTGDREYNLAQAIRYYQEALRFYLLDIEPFSYRRTARSLANLHFAQGAWRKALCTYRLAMQAGEQLYAVRCGETAEALLILEQGKTRLLTEALHLRVRRPPHVPDEIWDTFEQAGTDVRAKQAAKSPLMVEEKHDPVQAYEARVQEVQAVSGKLHAAIEQVRAYDLHFLEAINLSTIEAQLSERHTALITFCITEQGSMGFVLSQNDQEKIQVVEVPNFTRTALYRLLWGTDEQPTDGWLGTYAALDAWQETITQVLAALSEQLLIPILSTLSADIERIIFLPSAELFLFPLHAVPLSGNDTTLICDKYEVSYAPSLEVLAHVRARVTQEMVPALYAVINPEENLLFAPTEGAAIAQFFAQNAVDRERVSTKERVLAGMRERTYIYFACHGSYDWDNPPASGLILAAGEHLTLADLQQGDVDLSIARLVTLSACETGVTDVMRESAGEYVGIPAGFLLAGVLCVISSLWAVQDLSTALLMEHFYQNHLQGGMAFAAALREAQRWICRATAKEMALADKWQQIYQNSREPNVHAFGQMRYYRFNPEVQPFAHPYYWAAFTVNGL